MVLHRAAPFVSRVDLQGTPAGHEARVAFDDSVFQGHYPNQPILPGLFLVEALFQCAEAVLGGEWRLDEIGSCRFQSPVLPGDPVMFKFTVGDDGAGGRVVEAAAAGRSDAGEFRLRLVPAAADRLAIAPQAEVRPGFTWEQAAQGGRALDQPFIRKVLPHRYPMLLVDQMAVAAEDTPKPVLVSKKAVTIGEPWYAASQELPRWGYPGCLVAESFCQSCGLLRAATSPPGTQRDPSRMPVLARLVKLRMVGEVFPGEILEHHVRLAARMPDGAVFSGESVVGGRLVMTVERILAATAQRPG